MEGLRWRFTEESLVFPCKSAQFVEAVQGRDVGYGPLLARHSPEGPSDPMKLP